MRDASDIVDRADSLIRRRRSFVSQRPLGSEVQEDGTLPVLTEEDIPLLSAHEKAYIHGEAEKWMQRLSAELTRLFTARLTNELPAIIAEALHNTEEEFQLKIAGLIETVLREGIEDDKKEDNKV